MPGSGAGNLGADVRKLTLNWSGETLPKFVEWKSRASGDFAIGLEPATYWLDDHFAREPLAPEERVVNKLTLILRDFSC